MRQAARKPALAAAFLRSRNSGAAICILFETRVISSVLCTKKFRSAILNAARTSNRTRWISNKICSFSQNLKVFANCVRTQFIDKLTVQCLVIISIGSDLYYGRYCENKFRCVARLRFFFGVWLFHHILVRFPSAQFTLLFNYSEIENKRANKQINRKRYSKNRRVNSGICGFILEILRCFVDPVAKQ